MARTKQTRRKPAPHEEVHVLRVGVPGQQSAIRKRAPGSSIRALASVPVSASAPVSSVRLPNAKASVASVQASVRLPASVGLQPKKVSPQDVFNCNEMMRELESAAVHTLAAVFDCSQLRDAIEEIPTVYSRDIQGTMDTRVPKEQL